MDINSINMWNFYLIILYQYNSGVRYRGKNLNNQRRGVEATRDLLSLSFLNPKRVESLFKLHPSTSCAYLSSKIPLFKFDKLVAGSALRCKTNFVGSPGSTRMQSKCHTTKVQIQTILKQVNKMRIEEALEWAMEESNKNKQSNNEKGKRRLFSG